jgi:hypothetical protein
LKGKGELMKLRTATLLLTMMVWVPSLGAQGSESFVAISDLSEGPRVLHRATFLLDGRVLITGGVRELNQPVANAEIFDPFPDPLTGVFHSVPLMDCPNLARAFHRATLLLDGTVLITGGGGGAEIFYPSSETCSPTFGPMITARSGHTATRLGDGTVLITGGRLGNTFLDTAELYDPATGMFTPVGDMEAIRHRHTATLLTDGTVLVAGGQNASGGILDSAELFDPITGMFISTGPMTKPRGVDHTATLLLDGEVLLVGGRQLNPPIPSEPSADLYNPFTKTFREAAGHMKGLRNFHTATLLNDGTVLVAGGRIAETVTTFRAEIYDPLTEQFKETDHMTVERDFHTATALDDGSGTVLITGGFGKGSNVPTVEPTAEIFVP